MWVGLLNSSPKTWGYEGSNAACQKPGLQPALKRVLERGLPAGLLCGDASGAGSTLKAGNNMFGFFCPALKVEEDVKELFSRAIYTSENMTVTKVIKGAVCRI